MEYGDALDADEERELRDALEGACTEHQTAKSQEKEDARQRYSEALRRFSGYVLQLPVLALCGFSLGCVANR
jgi:hypothetical protein